MQLKKSNNLVNKIGEMIQKVNQSKTKYYACVLPEKKGNQGVFISEHGYMPIISYAILYSDEEDLKVIYDCVLNGKIATIDEMARLIKNTESEVIIFSDNKQDGGFCVKNNKFVLEEGDRGFAYVYMKCVSDIDNGEVEHFLYVYDYTLHHHNGKMMKICLGKMEEETSKLILRMTEIIAKKER